MSKRENGGIVLIKTRSQANFDAISQNVLISVFKLYFASYYATGFKTEAIEQMIVQMNRFDGFNMKMEVL